VHPLRHPSAPAAATIDSIPSDTAFGTIKPLIRALLEEKDARLEEKEARLEKEYACIEQMAARLDDKDALIKKSEELANARETELIRAAAEVHAVYSPRAIISSIIETLSPGACGIATGEKYINSFIDKYIYNTGKGWERSTPRGSSQTPRLTSSRSSAPRTCGASINPSTESSKMRPRPTTM
jgi:hypothetical protein